MILAVAAVPVTNKVETSHTLNINYTKSKEGKEEEEQERKVAR